VDGIGVFFFVLFSLTRFGFNLGFLDRPLVVGLLWAALTGQWEVALPVAVFWELFFLDLFPIGTYVPPQSLFALLTTLALAHIFNVHQPSLVFVLMVACLPTAYLGSRLEHLHRRWQNVSYNKVLQSTRAGHESQASGLELARNALLHMAALNLLGFLVVMALLVPFIDWLLHQFRGDILVMPVTWPHIWMLGTIGAILSLRSRAVYALLLVFVTLAGGYVYFQAA
jgi:mannose/fructose/N-acetylgalactosamine-specific phosphotransferase system component IIC